MTGLLRETPLDRYLSLAILVMGETGSPNMAAQETHVVDALLEY
jgi:hypothetical protein